MTINNKENITIIVNTCDRFEDCWNPFFILLEKFWTNCQHPIILTTFDKKYNYSGNLNIKSLQASKHYHNEPSWCGILLHTINKLSDDDIVLLMLDDFFISDYIDSKTISKCYKIMKENNYSNITLTNHDTKRSFESTKNPMISQINQKSKYRITTSPALWKVSALKRYLFDDENIWMFELFGTARSHKIKDSFFRFNEECLSPGFKEVIPYFQGDDDTGIVKGKWQKGIEKLFKNENINIDFSKRGYYKSKTVLEKKIDTILKIIKHPKQLIRAILY
tara:strand:+ start:174 stop:1007 length:834 start_codon:yes stop_codon:yes gene_type:complete